MAGNGLRWLGVARAVSGISHDHVTVVESMDGLTQLVRCPMFPFDLNGINLVFAGSFPPGATGVIHIGTLHEPTRWGSYSITFGALVPPEASLDEVVPHSNILALQLLYPGKSLLLRDPMLLFVRYKANNAAEAELLGFLEFAFDPPAPLTDPERTALLADPNVKNVVFFTVGSRSHGRELTAFYSLNKDRTALQLGPNQCWVEDLPEEFDVGDGEPPVPLKYIKQALPGFFRLYYPVGSPSSAFANPRVLGMHQAFTADVLQRTIEMFIRLLNTDPPEVEVQRFIENNPVMLCPFAPRQLVYQPKISTEYVADFALVTARAELLLIEIERPGMELFKQNGGKRAPLEHAFDQVRSWFSVIDPHRNAIVEHIPGIQGPVVHVRGCVIAGRTNGLNAMGLARLQGSPDPRIEFLTYDQLIEAVVSTFRTSRLIPDASGA